MESAPPLVEFELDDGQEDSKTVPEKPAEAEDEVEEEVSRTNPNRMVRSERSRSRSRKR